MATLGRWSNGTTTLIPTTSFAAPNGLFGTQDRNDSSAYTFTNSTATITLPSSGLADGYLFRTSIEFEDTSNGRFNMQGRFQQTGGTGNFVTMTTSGYCRDTSEDRAFVQVVAFLDNPSASATVQFQWQRDADAPTGGTVQSIIEVVPFHYANIGMYSSTTAALLGGTTRNTVAIGTTVVESDTAAIQRTTNTVAIKGDNKRYLIIGGVYGDGFSNGSRTQRVIGLSYDGTADAAAQSYFFARNAANDTNGAFVWDLHETATADVDVTLTCYRGAGVAADQGGADVDGATPSAAANALVVIELNDDAACFRGHDGTGLQDLTPAGPVDLNIARTADVRDSATWGNDNTVDFFNNTGAAMDAFVGANIFSARNNVSSGSRFTARAHLTVEAVEDAATRHGQYTRGNQSSQDCFGGGWQPGGYVELAAGEGVGVSVQELSGSEGGGTDRTQAGSAGFWGVDLDSLAAPSGPTITDAEDEVFVDQEQTITVTGTNFGATQGTGKIEVGNNAVYASATKVNLQVNSWGDTSIDCDMEETGTGNPIADDLTLGSLWLFVTNDSSDVSAGYAVTVNEVGASWKAALNTNWTQDVDENARIRFLVQETAGTAYSDQAFKLQYNRNSGGWNDVNAASSVVRSSASSHVADAADTIQLLGSGTFVSPNNGFDEVNGAVGGTDLDGAGSDEVELEFCVQIRGVDVADADTIELRVVQNDGTALDTYTNTPSITVNKVGGGPTAIGQPGLIMGL